MESPFLRLKSTLPARRRRAWAQIEVEINGVETNCTPRQGWHANSSFTGPAAEPAAKRFHYATESVHPSNAKNQSASFKQMRM